MTNKHDYLSKASVLPGIDGRKMSKSYGNEIPFAAGPEEVLSRVRMMVTDPQRIKKTDKGNPEVCTVYTFHKIFNSDQCNEIANACKEASIGCVECKKRLAEKMIADFADMHSRRKVLEANPTRVKEILAYGAEKARKVAQATMEEVRQALNL